MSEYVKLIKRAEDLLNQLLDDTKHGQVILKGANGLSDIEIRKPSDFDKLPLGSVISIGVCEYFLVSDGLNSNCVSYDFSRILGYQEMYIELVKAQEEGTSVMLRYKGA